ncbi:MAG: helix-turn-helix domain-containing protein [Anaerolineae bacterium]
MQMDTEAIAWETDAASAPGISENKVLGEQIWARRAELGLGQRELARATGLSATFIGNLERGRANPTLETLRKVAHALGTPLFRLLAGPAEASPVVRRDRRRHVRVLGSHIDIEVLTPDLLHKMVLFQVRASRQDGNLVVGALPLPTEECFVVLQGRLEVTAADQVYELAPGDSIYVEGRTLQAIRVLSDEDAVYIGAMTPPVF